jgi:hypothetical protein
VKQLLLPILLVLSVVFSAAAADEPVLKPNDVIALIGGEDMVACAEYGYLELLLQSELPAHRLKIRCLAWEGDTVYEQPRMLNYPPLEQRLEQIGATVVLAQFGRMEAVDGSERVPEFLAAYEKMFQRLRGSGKRRIIIIPPTPPTNYVFGRTEWFEVYDNAVKSLAKSYALPALPFLEQIASNPAYSGVHHRDGVHLNGLGQTFLAKYVTMLLPPYRRVSKSHNPPVPDTYIPPPPAIQLAADGTAMAEAREERVRQTIIAKNRLWDRYRRPQNWAFLAGDRVSQPSSRDWRDPKKRWFPEEMEQFLPLIEQKEKEIWELAAKLKEESK